MGVYWAAGIACVGLFESGRFTQVLLLSVLLLCMLYNFSCFCCRLLTFFKINFFQKILPGTEYQTVRVQIRMDILLLLIGVQTVNVISGRQKSP